VEVKVDSDILGRGKREKYGWGIYDDGHCPSGVHLGAINAGKGLQWNGSRGV